MVTTHPLAGSDVSEPRIDEFAWGSRGGGGQGVGGVILGFDESRRALEAVQG